MWQHCCCLVSGSDHQLLPRQGILADSVPFNSANARTMVILDRASILDSVQELARLLDAFVLHDEFQANVDDLIDCFAQLNLQLDQMYRPSGIFIKLLQYCPYLCGTGLMRTVSLDTVEKKCRSSPPLTSLLWPIGNIFRRPLQFGS